MVQRVSGREGSDTEPFFFFFCPKKMNENQLTESAAYWSKIILGSKSQSEHCNNLAAMHTQMYCALRPPHLKLLLKD